MSSSDEEEESDNLSDIDFSVISTSIQVGGTMVNQIINSINYGSPEVRNLLQNECDVIIECKVCRNFFRNIPMFVAHKRIYCRGFSTSSQDMLSNQAAAAEDEIVVIQPQSAEDSVGDQDQTQISTIDHLKDGTFHGTSEAYKLYTQTAQRIETQKVSKAVSTITMTEIPTNPNAVLVNVEKNVVNQSENELQNISEAVAVESQNKNKDSKSNSAGHSELLKMLTKKNGNVPDSSTDKNKRTEMEHSTVGIIDSKKGKLMPPKRDLRPVKSQDATKSELSELVTLGHCNVQKLNCLLCKLTFVSQKGLLNHMHSIHSGKKTVYPCILCKSKFSYFWGLTRHLKMNHRKSKEQVDKMREKLRSQSYTILLDDDLRRNLKISDENKKDSVTTVNVENETSSDISMNVKRSVRTPGGITLNKCDGCGKAFWKRQSYDEHTRQCKWLCSSVDEQSIYVNRKSRRNYVDINGENTNSTLEKDHSTNILESDAKNKKQSASTNHAESRKNIPERFIKTRSDSIDRNITSRRSESRDMEDSARSESSNSRDSSRSEKRVTGHVDKGESRDQINSDRSRGSSRNENRDQRGASRSESRGIKDVSRSESGDRKGASRSESGDRKGASRSESGDRKDASRSESVDRKDASRSESGDRKGASRSESGDRKGASRSESGDRKDASRSESGDRKGASRSESGDRKGASRSESGDGKDASRSESGDRKGASRSESGDRKGASRSESGDGKDASRSESGDRKGASRSESGDRKDASRSESGDRKGASRSESGDRKGASRSESRESRNSSISEVRDSRDTSRRENKDRSVARGGNGSTSLETTDMQMVTRNIATRRGEFEKKKSDTTKNVIHSRYVNDDKSPNKNTLNMLNSKNSRSGESSVESSKQKSSPDVTPKKYISTRKSDTSEKITHENSGTVKMSPTQTGNSRHLDEEKKSSVNAVSNTRRIGTRSSNISSALQVDEVDGSANQQNFTGANSSKRNLDEALQVQRVLSSPSVNSGDSGSNKNITLDSVTVPAVSSSKYMSTGTAENSTNKEIEAKESRSSSRNSSLDREIMPEISSRKYMNTRSSESQKSKEKEGSLSQTSSRNSSLERDINTPVVTSRRSINTRSSENLKTKEGSETVKVSPASCSSSRNSSVERETTPSKSFGTRSSFRDKNTDRSAEKIIGSESTAENKPRANPKTGTDTGSQDKVFKSTEDKLGTHPETGNNASSQDISSKSFKSSVSETAQGSTSVRSKRQRVDSNSSVGSSKYEQTEKTVETKSRVDNAGNTYIIDGVEISEVTEAQINARKSDETKQSDQNKPKTLDSDVMAANNKHDNVKLSESEMMNSRPVGSDLAFTDGKELSEGDLVNMRSCLRNARKDSVKEVGREGYIETRSSSRDSSADKTPKSSPGIKSLSAERKTSVSNSPETCSLSRSSSNERKVTTGTVDECSDQSECRDSHGHILRSQDLGHHTKADTGKKEVQSVDIEGMKEVVGLNIDMKEGEVTINSLQNFPDLQMITRRSLETICPKDEENVGEKDNDSKEHIGVETRHSDKTKILNTSDKVNKTSQGNNQNAGFLQTDTDESLKTLYPCILCSKQFCHFWSLTRHLRINHHKSQQQVELLRGELKARSYIGVETRHSDKTKLLNTSDKVNKTSQGNNQNAGFLQTNTDESLKTLYPCILCSKQFCYYWGLTRHLRINHHKTKYQTELLRGKLKARSYKGTKDTEKPVKRLQNTRHRKGNLGRNKMMQQMKGRDQFKRKGLTMQTRSREKVNTNDKTNIETSIEKIETKGVEEVAKIGDSKKWDFRTGKRTISATDTRNILKTQKSALESPRSLKSLASGAKHKTEENQSSQLHGGHHSRREVRSKDSVKSVTSKKAKSELMERSVDIQSKTSPTPKEEIDRNRDKVAGYNTRRSQEHQESNDKVSGYNTRRSQEQQESNDQAFESMTFKPDNDGETVTINPVQEQNYLGMEVDSNPNNKVCIEEIWVGKEPGQPSKSIRCQKVIIESESGKSILSKMTVRRRKSPESVSEKSAKSKDKGNKKMYVLDPGKSSQPRCLDSKRVDNLICENHSTAEQYCLQCGMAFSNVSNLRRHIVRHLGWKRYKCKLCSFASYNRSECSTHLRRTHAEKLIGASVQNFVIDLNKEANKLRTEKKQNTMSLRNTDPGISPRKSYWHRDRNTKQFPVKILKKVTSETESSDVKNATAEIKVHRLKKKNLRSKNEDRRKPGVKVENIKQPAGTKYNISTRNSSRVFDTSPYKQIDKMETLTTRQSYYPKEEKMALRSKRDILSDVDNEEVLPTSHSRIKSVSHDQTDTKGSKESNEQLSSDKEKNRMKEERNKPVREKPMVRKRKRSDSEGNSPAEKTKSPGNETSGIVKISPSSKSKISKEDEGKWKLKRSLSHDGIPSSQVTIQDDICSQSVVTDQEEDASLDNNNLEEQYSELRQDETEVRLVPSLKTMMAALEEAKATVKKRGRTIKRSISPVKKIHRLSSCDFSKDRFRRHSVDVASSKASVATDRLNLDSKKLEENINDSPKHCDDSGLKAKGASDDSGLKAEGACMDTFNQSEDTKSVNKKDCQPSASVSDNSSQNKEGDESNDKNSSENLIQANEVLLKR